MKLLNSYKITYSVYDALDGNVLQNGKETEISAKSAEEALQKLDQHIERKYPNFPVEVVITQVIEDWHEL